MERTAKADGSYQLQKLADKATLWELCAGNKRRYEESIEYDGIPINRRMQNVVVKAFVG